MTTIQAHAYDDFPQAVKIAQALIESCERDLNRKLTRGECNDLLMDNTTWSRSAIVAVMDSIQPIARTNTNPMQHYVLIDENSGYVWGDCYATTPALACQEIDENLGVSDRQYEDIGHELFNGRSGYHVHIAHELFVPIDDGREPLLINAVSALPLAARVVTRNGQEG